MCEREGEEGEGEERQAHLRAAAREQEFAAPERHPRQARAGLVGESAAAEDHGGAAVEAAGLVVSALRAEAVGLRMGGVGARGCGGAGHRGWGGG